MIGWIADALRALATKLDGWSSRGDSNSKCSFCTKHRTDVEYLIAGPNRTYICEDCVELSRQILEETGYYRRRDAESKTEEDPE